MADLKQIRTLVFDFDGTLATCPYDFAYMRRAVTAVASNYGLTHEHLGPRTGLLETIDIGTGLLGEETECGKSFRSDAMAALCAIEYEAAALTELLPGILDTLHALKNGGFRMGIITRNSAAAVQRIIGERQLPVERMLCREDVRNAKPHPEHVESMLALLHSQPAAAMMVGDHPMDVETGKAAGMHTAAVLTGQTDEATLRAAGPDLLFPSVVELASVLLQEV